MASIYSIIAVWVVLSAVFYFLLIRKKGLGKVSQPSRSIFKPGDGVARTTSKKAKAKAKKLAKKLEDTKPGSEEASIKATKKIDEKGSVENGVRRDEPQVITAEPDAKPTLEPVDVIPETPSSKKKKSNKAKTEAAPAVVETPAPTPELIPEDAPETNGVDFEPSEVVEATTKTKKKKNKKPKASKDEEVPAITESILTEPKELELTEELEFTKPTKASVVKPSSRYLMGVSERKPIESVNPWALLAED